MRYREGCQVSLSTSLLVAATRKLFQSDHFASALGHPRNCFCQPRFPVSHSTSCRLTLLAVGD
jgi:UDP-N-acetylglucosamine pyrophosphorylase